MLALQFLGPHCGVVAAAPALLGELRMDKLLPSTDDVPERFELGTLPYELMAGTTAAIDFLAGLARGAGAADTSRRAHLLRSYAVLEAHEDRLRSRLEPVLRELPGVTVYSNAGARTPTMLFRIAGRDSQDVRKALATKGINAPAGNFYAIECSRHLGLADEGGVRVGLAPYSNDDDIDRLIAALQEITQG